MDESPLVLVWTCDAILAKETSIIILISLDKWQGLIRARASDPKANHCLSSAHESTHREDAYLFVCLCVYLFTICVVIYCCITKNFVTCNNEHLLSHPVSSDGQELRSGLIGGLDSAFVKGCSQTWLSTKLFWGHFHKQIEKIKKIQEFGLNVLLNFLSVFL